MDKDRQLVHRMLHVMGSKPVMIRPIVQVIYHHQLQDVKIHLMIKLMNVVANVEKTDLMILLIALIIPMSEMVAVIIIEMLILLMLLVLQITVLQMPISLIVIV